MAPDASLLAVNVLHWEEDGDGWNDIVWGSDFIEGVNWAVTEGADVINASLVGFSESDPMRDAIESATNSGVLVVVSAGNTGGDGCDDDCVNYPAAYEDAVAVAATTVNDSVAWFSSRGPEVAVGAPGSSVISTVPDFYDDRYSSFSGTSMASPHVAGLAALVKAHTDRDDPEEIRNRIESTAEEIDERELAVGEGLIDPVAALDVDLSPTVSTGSGAVAGPREATFAAEVTDFGTADSVDVAFEYGPEGSDLDQTADAGTLDEPGDVSATVTGLSDGTTYAFRVVAEGASEGAGDTNTVTTPSLACPYTNENDVVELDGVREVIQDWQTGEADADALQSTIDAWARGEPITSCP